MEGSCLAPGPSFTAYAVVTIVSDIVVAGLPIPMLLALNIQFEKKLGLMGIFALGLFTTVCSILRYLQIDRIQNGDGNTTMLILWGVIEFNVGVSHSFALLRPSLLLFSVSMRLIFFLQNLVSSLPFLAPMFIKKAKEYRSKQSSGSGSGRGKGNGGCLGFKSSEGYELSDRGNTHSVFISADRNKGPTTSSTESML
jgi:hypothetical protein